MRKEIKDRILELEARLLAPKPPTFEEWTEEWQTMDKLSQALYIEAAEGAEEILEHEYLSVITGYLERMNLIKPNTKKSLHDIAKEMEKQRAAF